jgi:RNA polymerase sigma factor (sigma-70 family)
MTRPGARLCGPRDSEFAEYLRSIRAYPLLTASEEKDLASRYRDTGCTAARDELACANLRLVVHVAKRYAAIGPPIQDLVEAGNLGLLRAVARFDPEKGVRFATYAVWWIKRGIIEELEQHGCLVHVPPGPKRDQRACRAVVQQLGAVLGRPATADEVAHSTGLPLRTVQWAQTSPTGQRIVRGDEDSDHLGAASDPRIPDADAAMLRTEAQGRVRACLRSLPGKEAEIIRLHYGIEGRAALTYRDIGKQLGISEQSVERLAKAALLRLEIMLRTEPAAHQIAGDSRIATA